MARKRKTKYKPKYKGVRYVASRLRKYYPKRYVSYNDALARAGVIVSDLKKSESKITWKAAREFETSTRKSLRPGKNKVDDPVLSENLLSGEYMYYHYQDVIGDIESSDPRIMFQSSMIEDVFRGGDRIDESVFKNISDQLNITRKDPDSGVDPYTAYKFNRPTLVAGNWISRFYLIDQKGQPIEIDLEVSDLEFKEPAKDKVQKRSEKQREKQKDSTSNEKEIQELKTREAEANLKSKQLDMIMKLVDKGMSFDEAAEKVGYTK